MKHTQLTNHGAHLGANKPEAPRLQLPPPPPGMRWHRTDGWQESDLPQGCRPLFLGEPICEQVDEWKQVDENSDTWVKRIHVYPDECTGAQAKKHSLHRTRRPLTFTHEGKTWTWHRPGDPMPCDGGEQIEVFWRTMPDSTDFTFETRSAKVSNWAKNTTVIGWRYADEKKTVPLGPEDVPPGSVLQKHDDGTYYTPLCVSTANDGVYLHDTLPFQESYEDLSAEWKINRSIPLTGKWDANAWEPCSKEVAV